MQNVGSALLAVLQSDERDLVDCFEFYAPTTTALTPASADLRVSSTEVSWNGFLYQQQQVTRGDVSRYFDSKFNSVSITLSNVDRTIGTLIRSAGSFEGYRVIVRCISRRVNDDSIVLFVGRCEKAFDVDNDSVSISARQDLGAIDNEFPWRIFSQKCQIEFKGTECLAGEALGAKSAAYQAATLCNKSFGQCTQYVNTNAFQGFRFNAQTGNFKVTARRGGAGGALLGLIGLGNKRVTKQWTSQDGTPYGKPIPFGFGRTQIALIGTQYADTGQYLAGWWVVGEGELAALLNVRNVSSGWADTFQDYDQHLGKYGTDAAQAPTRFFSGTGDKNSHTAYIEATILGENPDTGDPAPTIVAVSLWIKIPAWNGSAFSAAAWSDKAPEILRYLITEVRSLNYNSSWIDTATFGAAVDYCDEPMVDDTGGDDVYVSSSAGTPGVDYKRYRSTGVIDTYHFRYLLGLDASLPATRETTVTTFNPATPPANPAATRRYRRRYTCNFHLSEREKVAETVFKKILPSFRGNLLTGADGKLQLKIEKPMPTSLLRATVSAGSSALPIEDAFAWKSQTLPVIYALIGWELGTSEVRQVSSVDYSITGNSITLSASASGSLSATASGATLSGGSTSVQASGTVTIGGSNSAGQTITITIDGIANTYTTITADTTGTIAGMMATIINANLTLNRYIKAEWAIGSPNVVTIKSKLGTLNLASTTANAHAILERVIQVHLPFAHSGLAYAGLSRGNVLRNTFKWPLGGRQTSFNQFVLVYVDAVQDFQETEVRENDYPHQTKINKINKMEIDGACIDNYHQADRILQGARYKYREGDFFNSWATAGPALLLEEGDVVCATHDSMPGERNLTLRLEEVKVSADWRISMLGRKYTASQFPEESTPRTVALTAGIGWPSASPGAPVWVSLSEVQIFIARGVFTFAPFVGGQYARILVKRSDSGVYQDAGLVIYPDAAFGGIFELSGLPAGSNCFMIQAFNQADNSLSATSVELCVTLTGAPASSPGSRILYQQVNNIDPMAVGSGDPLEYQVFSRR